MSVGDQIKDTIDTRTHHGAKEERGADETIAQNDVP